MHCALHGAMCTNNHRQANTCLLGFPLKLSIKGERRKYFKVTEHVCEHTVHCVLCWHRTHTGHFRSPRQRETELSLIITCDSTKV